MHNQLISSLGGHTVASSENLQHLVAQHYERLDKILGDTIKALEELKSQVPDSALKDEHPLCIYCKKPHPAWIFSCNKAAEYVAREHKQHVLNVHINCGGSCPIHCG